MKKIIFIQLILLVFGIRYSFSQDSTRFVEISRFAVPEARQGIAVDEAYFYGIDSRQVTKNDKKTGKLIKKWQEKENGPIIHLDSGIIVDGQLICAHSNYPGIPMTSSVEIWDTETMNHIQSHSFGISWGSCTWIDRYEDYWWAAFAHYNKFSEQNNTTNAYSSLLKFDDKWQVLEAWVYPPEVIERFDGMSNSGGSWGPDGLLYLTGHDRGELYVMSLPKAGSVLVLEEIIPVGIEGQGIAWDRSQKDVLYTIRRKEREVVVFQIMR